MMEDMKMYEIPEIAVTQPLISEDGKVLDFVVDKNEVDPASDAMLSAGIWLLENRDNFRNVLDTGLYYSPVNVVFTVRLTLNV